MSLYVVPPMAAQDKKGGVRGRRVYGYQAVHGHGAFAADTGPVFHIDRAGRHCGGHRGELHNQAEQFHRFLYEVYPRERGRKQEVHPV